jgi:L-alanine-DL-glutamate epimerase-like enolase superfamily enzyme
VKISGVNITPLVAANGATTPVHALVELNCDTELTGLAIVAHEAAPSVHALVRELLTGADPRATMGWWERMGAALLQPDAAAGRARAALDIAMWDLKAKANGEPLWKTLGGTRCRMNAHLAWDGPADGSRMTDWFRRMHAGTGIRSGSLPATGDPDADVVAMAEVRAVLHATVPQSSLMLHFDGTGWPGEAVRHIRALESHVDLTWVRSPVRRGDFQAARRVGDSIRAAVCIGRGLTGMEAYLPYLQHYAANVIELDIAVLGVSGCIQMADAAFGLELPVVLSDYAGHLPVQLFPAFATATSVEFAYRTCTMAGPSPAVSFEDGRVLAGTEPGNGLSIDRAALAAATTGASR